MIGTIRWNVYAGFLGFLLTFTLSVGGNFVIRALLHGLYSFLIVFTVVFVLRWLLGTVGGLKEVPPLEAAADLGNGGPDEATGQAFDQRTPDEEEHLNDLLKDQLKPPAGQAQEEGGSFVPLAPQKLKAVSDAEAEELAQAMRHLKEK